MPVIGLCPSVDTVGLKSPRENDPLARWHNIVGLSGASKIHPNRDHRGLHSEKLED